MSDLMLFTTCLERDTFELRPHAMGTASANKLLLVSPVACCSEFCFQENVSTNKERKKTNYIFSPTVELRDTLEVYIWGLLSCTAS